MSITFITITNHTDIQTTNDQTNRPSVPAVPTIDRSLKPGTTAPAADGGSLLEGRLRTVTVPADTCTRFLNLALHDINRNRETCGILAGVLAHNTLRITHVIVPKQCGTADSCTTMSEEDIFDVQERENLITLGWIHVSGLILGFFE